MSEESDTGNFFKDEFSPPSRHLLDAFNESVEQCREGMKANAYNHYTGDPSSRRECLHWRKSPWSNNCADCRAPLEQERLDDEKIISDKFQRIDRQLALVQPHNHRIHALGIRADALVAFAFAHDCWDWTTRRVVRDIIVPATRGTRCRYGELSKTSNYFAPATVFASHCWAARFGDLVGAVCHGANKDRFIWIDIFAVRQWPGNHDDFEFRSILSRCKAMILSISTVHSLTKPLQSESEQRLWFCRIMVMVFSVILVFTIIITVAVLFCMSDDSSVLFVVFVELCVVVLIFALLFWGFSGKCRVLWCLVKSSPENIGPVMQYIESIETATRSQFLASDEGEQAKPAISTCRLYCIAEIAAAVDYEIPIVVKSGEVEKNIDGNFRYNQEGSETMLGNLQYMVDAESSTCTSPEDTVREMNIIQEMVGGVEHVNNVVAGVIAGALQSIKWKINEGNDFFLIFFVFVSVSNLCFWLTIFFFFLFPLSL